MKRIHLIPLTLVALAGCGRPEGQPSRTSSPARVGTQAGQALSLAEARRGFRTNLTRRESANQPVPEPPPRLFRTVRYDSPVGKLAAYLTPDPKDGKKHPAIIWITGGDCNTLDQ